LAASPSRPLRWHRPRWPSLFQRIVPELAFDYTEDAVLWPETKTPATSASRQGSARIKRRRKVATPRGCPP
jgi:hypothetical protein